MVSSRKAAALLAGAVFSAFGVHQASAVVIVQYSFTATTPTPSTTEAATTSLTGTNTATALGMTNSYTYANGEGPGSVDGSNIVSTSGTANTSFTESMFRIVGNSNTKNSGTGKADGWNNSAPNYTQGAEFGASTTGYAPTSLSFDWYCTSAGVANLQVLYTLDGSTWTPLGSDLIATSNDFYGAATGSPSNTVDLTSISAAATNDPNFAVELVSVKPVAGDANFASTPNPTTNYASAAGGDYNNSSGNWRFDNITISGTAVPEPASASLLGLAGLALLRARRKQNV